MHAAVRAALPGASVLIMAAAVADWRPSAPAAQKLKKGAATMSLDLVPTVDILRALRDDELASGVFRVGFAAETEHVLDHAHAKLIDKALDLVVVNDVSQPGIGMGADENEVTVLDRAGGARMIARAPKAVIAEAIVAIIAARLA
jgi:phosphopantothenoylcysteine decarboxylase / phosphopantothenate---cysteine ligase